MRASIRLNTASIPVLKIEEMIKIELGNKDYDGLGPVQLTYFVSCERVRLLVVNRECNHYNQLTNQG
jgi:hypothetical protein